jgi:hypothetical protein
VSEPVGLGSDLARLEGDDIVIRVPLSAIPFAAEVAFGEANYDCDEFGFPRMVVTAVRTFAYGMLRELNREAEDGSTPIHLLLDKAIIGAAEQGTEGLEQHELAKQNGE